METVGPWFLPALPPCRCLPAPSCSFKSGHCKPLPAEIRRWYTNDAVPSPRFLVTQCCPTRISLTFVTWTVSRHGKFRPTLMKLVSSNEPGFVKDTIREAVALYRDKSDLSGALNILTRLKGIGPATASLLLAVHDPERVIFFADEAFYWLCCNGTKAPIKYNLQEYIELDKQAQSLSKRLGVKAVDVERVAFVLMRQPKSKEAASANEVKPPTRSPANGEGKKRPTKRKASGDAPVDAAPLRRSKRSQASARGP